MNNSLDALHPYVKILALKFLEACEKENFPVKIIMTYRTIEEQNALYAQGRTKPGNIVTNAKGGSSYHNYRLAFDAVPVINGKINWDDEKAFKKMGAIGTSVGLEWGGNWPTFKDTPHFQWTGGLSISDLRAGKKPVSPIDGAKVDSNTNNKTDNTANSIKLLRFDSTKLFQEKMGLTADGIIGPKTKAAIDEIMSKKQLKKGSKGVAVRYLQYRLGINIDGDFGSKTEASLKKWQTTNKLTANGVCSTKEWDILL